MRVGLAIAWLAAAVGPLGASVIFTDLGSSPGAGLGVEGSSQFGGPESLAAAFTPAANSSMNEAQVKVFFEGLGDPDFNLYLYSNSSGAPGSSLETLGTDLIAPSLTASIVTESSFAPLALTGGTQYWLVMTPFDSNSNVAWVLGGSPAVQSDDSGTSNGSGPWFSNGDLGLQFEIDGTTSVPEPGTVGLVAAGLGLAALISRNRIARCG